MRCLATAALAASLAAIASCGAKVPRTPLPLYTGHTTQLFDDTIEPMAVGYDLERTAPPMNDMHLRERAQVGDAVVRARVDTVTAKDGDRGRTWQIGCHTIERLGGFGSLPDDFAVRIEPNGASAGIMRAFGGRLVGMTFVAFVAGFARPEAPGESDLHFHFVQDGKAQVAAVRSALTLVH